MPINKKEPLPKNFSSLEDFWSFWDTHSTADYEDLMEDVDVQLDLHSSKKYYAVAKDLSTQLQTQAQQQGVSTETLINLWLRERLSHVVNDK